MAIDYENSGENNGGAPKVKIFNQDYKSIYKFDPADTAATEESAPPAEKGPQGPPAEADSNLDKMLDKSQPERSHRWRNLAMGLGVVAVIGVGGWMGDKIVSPHKSDPAAEAHLNIDQHSITKTHQAGRQATMPSVAPSPRTMHHRYHGHRSNKPSPNAAPLIPSEAPVTSFPPQSTPRSIQHKKLRPPTAGEVVSAMPEWAEMLGLTQYNMTDDSQALPDYTSKTATPLTSQLEQTPVGSINLAAVPENKSALLQTAIHTIKSRSALPTEVVYQDTPLSYSPVTANSLKQTWQLPSLQAMALQNSGVTLQELKPVFTKHFADLAALGVDAVDESAAMPPDVTTYTYQTIHKRVGPRGHKHRVTIHRKTAHVNPVDQQAALQFMQAEVAAAESAGLRVIEGSFPGVNAGANTKGYALTQQAGADIRVSPAAPSSATVKPPVLDPSTYQTLAQLDSKSEFYTGVLSDASFGKEPLTQTAVEAVEAGATYIDVNLPTGTTVESFDKELTQAAQQAIKTGKLSKARIDQDYLKYLNRNGIRATTAYKTLVGHAYRRARR